MSCGWPPEQARLNRSWMPGSVAWCSEAFAERWQKKALLFGADQPGKPCADAVDVDDRLVAAPAPSPLMKLSPRATAAVGRPPRRVPRSYR